MWQATASLAQQPGVWQLLKTLAEMRERHTLEVINLLHWSHVDFFLKISSLYGEKYYTVLFLEENPAGVIQPPIIQTSWEIDFDQQGEGED